MPEPQQQTANAAPAATSTAPSASTTGQAPTDPVAEAKRLISDAEGKLAAAEKRARINIVEARKFADEKKGIGAKLSEYEQLKKWKADQERLDQQAKLNKSAFLKSKFGDDWYDQVVQERLNGGAPTADTVALEVARVEEKLEKKFEEREAARQKEQEATRQQQVQNELRSFTAQAVEYAKSVSKEYPILEALGAEEQVGAALVQRIRAEHDRTIQRDEDGAVVTPGRLLTLKEAAEAIEADLVAIAEKAFGVEKYKTKLTDKVKPATVVPSGAPQLRRTEAERRTLSNDLTATTAGRTPATTDEERRARAVAAYAAVRAKAPTQ